MTLAEQAREINRVVLAQLQKRRHELLAAATREADRIWVWLWDELKAHDEELQFEVIDALNLKLHSLQCEIENKS